MKTSEALRATAAYLTTRAGAERSGGCHALAHILYGDWRQWGSARDSEAGDYYALCKPFNGEGDGGPFWFTAGLEGHAHRVLALCLTAAVAEDDERSGHSSCNTQEKP